MQPAFVVWDHSGGANQPDARFVLFDKYLAARVLLAQGNLAVGANDLECAGRPAWSKWCESTAMKE